MAGKESSIVPVERVENLILLLRGQKENGVCNKVAHPTILARG